MNPWILVTVAYAQDAENADGAEGVVETPTAQTEPAGEPSGEPSGVPSGVPSGEPAAEAGTVSSETVADPGGIPEGGFIGNDSYGAIPLGSGWGYVWAVYIVTWLTLLGYAGYLALRNRKTS